MRYPKIALIIGLVCLGFPQSAKGLSSEHPSSELIHAYIVVMSTSATYFRGIEYDKTWIKKSCDDSIIIQLLKWLGWMMDLKKIKSSMLNFERKRAKKL